MMEEVGGQHALSCEPKIGRFLPHMKHQASPLCVSVSGVTRVFKGLFVCGSLFWGLGGVTGTRGERKSKA